jgi:hypothetical protein
MHAQLVATEFESLAHLKLQDQSDKNWSPFQLGCLLKAILKYGDREWYLIHDYYTFLALKKEQEGSAHERESHQGNGKTPNQLALKWRHMKQKMNTDLRNLQK